MAANIKIPIACDKLTKKLVNVKDVPNGLECNCYCDSCNEDLIAVNKEKKQKAHFRHSNNSNCKFNNSFESYIHWLAKEVFQGMDKILLPPIYVYNLREGSKSYIQFMNEIKTFFKETNISTERTNESKFFSIVLQPQSEVPIKAIKIESIYKSSKGDVKVDIVIENGKNLLFVEPYFTNPINDEKFAKIVALDNSTVSINLMEFIRSNEYLFTIQEFKNFLTSSIQEKCWEYVKEEKVMALSKGFFKKLDNIIKEYKPNLEQNKKIYNSIEDNQKRKQQLLLELNKVSKEIKNLEKSIVPFPFDKLIEL